MLEEICLMHRAGKPVLVIPEFGGASRAIAAWILDESKNDDFDLLRFEHHWSKNGTRNPKLKEVVAGLRREQKLTEREAEKALRGYYDELQRLAVSYRDTIRVFLRKAEEGDSAQRADREKRPVDYFGLTPKQVKRLMITASMGMVRHLLVNCLVDRLSPREAD